MGSLSSKGKNRPALLKGANSIFMKGSGESGVLLLHGFKGSPGEMKELGELLQRAGYTVSIPRYPGHGTSLSEMSRSSVKTWFSCAREAYIELSSLCREISIVGLSMGGLFAMVLAAEFNPLRLVLISTPYSLKQKQALLAPFIYPFIKVLPARDNKLGINNPETRKEHLCYRGGNPVIQSFQLYIFSIKARSRLKKIQSGTLIVQSRLDKVIPEKSLENIYRHLGSADKEILWFEKSGHNILRDYDREELGRQVLRFLS